MPSVDFHLFLVTDRLHVRGHSLPIAIQDAVNAGLPAIQLRERDLPTRELFSLAQQIHTMTRDRAIPLIINDRADIAVALDLDGVHLRATSFPVSAARRVMGARRLIGVSAHSIEEVQRAGDDGADYVILGPVFETPSKLAFGAPLGISLLAEACHRSSIPVFAIGGISRERLEVVREAGAFGVAMIGGILGQENVGVATREISAAVRAIWPSQSQKRLHAR